MSFSVTTDDTLKGVKEKHTKLLFGTAVKAVLLATGILEPAIIYVPRNDPCVAGVGGVRYFDFLGESSAPAAIEIEVVVMAIDNIVPGPPMVSKKASFAVIHIDQTHADEHPGERLCAS
ncbi:hypothetical protein C8F04DRAFT_1278196 [Mycena alexandri]|uniref:Uncharacterized protein n=1 Tax=Mycena alexandri TaxID=1745969 RepID=A0AAD6RZ85_9AGAR|nr:hypothetical protein C8F04DRAFT_1278196 [Mycena alexandri]